MRALDMRRKHWADRASLCFYLSPCISTPFHYTSGNWKMNGRNTWQYRSTQKGEVLKRSRGQLANFRQNMKKTKERGGRGMRAVKPGLRAS